MSNAHTPISPPTGNVYPPVVTNGTTKPISHTTLEEAQGAATEFLLDHVGNQLLAGQPHLMQSPTHSTWIVPIHLSYIHTGPIGSVGVVAVDAEGGSVVAWTPIDQIKAASRALRATQEPDLTQRFQTFIAAPAVDAAV